MHKKICVNCQNLGTVCIFIFFLILDFVFLTKSPLHIWRGSDAGTDSGVFMTIAMMMDKGYMPYRDTFDHKGPLLYLINYLGRQIAVYRGVWIFEFVSLFVTMMLIYKIARLKCGKFLSCIVLLVSISLLFLFFGMGNFTEEYAMPFIAGALFIFLDYFMNRKISVTRLILCGLCFGGVCLLRPNMISVWVIFCIAVLIKCIKSREVQQLIVFTLFFMLGILLIMLPFILWLIANNSFIAFWDEYIRFNLIYTTSDSASWWSSYLSFNKPIVKFATIIAVYMLYREDERFLHGTYLCYLFCSLLFICIPGRSYSHYGMILVPAVAFPIASMFHICVEDLFSKRDRIGSLFIGICFLYILIIPDWLSYIPELREIYSLKGMENNSGLVNVVSDIVSNNTQEDDKISVYGNWNIIYILSDRAHATQYSYQFPIGQIMPDIMQSYFDELQEQLPTLIVIQRGYIDDRMESFLESNNYSLIYLETTNEEGKAMIYKYE